MRRLRRRLALWALPVALVAGLVGAKLAHQHIVAERALAQYLAGDAEAALNTASQLQWLNWVERWKPDYDLGTSLLAVDALEESRAALERALPLAGPIEQCPIRANLAIAIERLGDRAEAAGDHAAAVELWREALAVLEERDPACEGSGAAESLEESEERIREKLQEDDQEQESDGDSDEPDPNQPDPDRLDDIEQDLDRNQEQREDELRDHGSGGGQRVDEPW